MVCGERGWGMSLPSLRQHFGSEFAKSAFRMIDGELRIVGKFGQITQLEDGTFDVWFVGPDLNPLTGRRIASIAQNFPRRGCLKILEGEAYTRGRGKAFVLDIAPLAGVKKRRMPSDDQLQH